MMSYFQQTKIMNLIMFETQKSVKVNGKFYVQISMKKKFKYLNSVFMNALTEIG